MSNAKVRHRRRKRVQYQQRLQHIDDCLAARPALTAADWDVVTRILRRTYYALKLTQATDAEHAFLRRANRVDRQRYLKIGSRLMAALAKEREDAFKRSPHLDWVLWG